MPVVVVFVVFQHNFVHLICVDGEGRRWGANSVFLLVDNGEGFNEDFNLGEWL